jgi:hypothetical protein
MTKTVPLNSLREGQHFSYAGQHGLYVERLPVGISVRLREGTRGADGRMGWRWREDLWPGVKLVTPDYAPSCPPIRCGKKA